MQILDPDQLAEAQAHIAKVRALIVVLTPFAQPPDGGKTLAALQPSVLRLLLACTESWCEVTEMMWQEIIEQQATRH